MSSIHLFCLSAGFLLAVGLNAQVRRIDTLAKIGDVGYRVSCNNKKPDNNAVSINPVGFTGGNARPAYFNIRGILTGLVVDNFSDDNYPDLVLFISSADSTQKGSIIGICSHENTTMEPAYFPDIYNDPKLREGYKGHDQFTSFAGTVLRTYPLYKTGGNGLISDTLSGMKRVVQYKIAPDEGGHMAFKVLRYFEKE